MTQQTIQLLTKEEAADRLKCTVSWLESQCEARAVPFTKVGGRYRFTEGHLAEIVQLHEQRPEGSAPAGDSPATTTNRRTAPAPTPLPAGRRRLRRPKGA